MNIFKLLGFRKILFCFFKACLIMAFNIFFLLILIDEFISLPVLANIIWVKFIYFPLFYSILFYLFCLDAFLRPLALRIRLLSGLRFLFY